MSKLSVFKFKLNGQNADNITYMINNYLTSRGFVFNQEANAYLTQRPNDTAKNMAASAGLSAVASIATGSATAIAIYSFQKGFEFNIIGDDLIIKCYIYNQKYKSKNPIHITYNNSQAGSLYISDLKHSLFEELKNSNVTLMKTESEKINDGSSKRIMIRLLIVFGIMILCIIGLMLIMLK